MRRSYLLLPLVIVIAAGLLAIAWNHGNDNAALGASEGDAATSIAEPTSLPTEGSTISPTVTPYPSATPSPSPTPGLPPRMVASYPIAGDLAMRPSSPLVLVFDQPMDAASLEALWSLTPPIEGTFAWPVDTTVTFSPTEPWADGEYILSIGPGLRSREGGICQENLSLQFVVGGRGVPLPVLMYHHLRELEEDASEEERAWSVPPEAFRQQMEYLLANGYQTISPDLLADYLEGATPLPPKPVIITMDDGSMTVYTVAYPILKETRLRPALFLIPSHMVGYGAYLDWDMARELVAAGFYIGVHSHDHIQLRGLGEDDLRIQIEQAKIALSEGLGVPLDSLDSFCYPMGGYDENTLAALQRYGYRTAFTLNPSVYQNPDEPYQLSRLRVDYDTTLQEFAEMLP